MGLLLVPSLAFAEDTNETAPSNTSGKGGLVIGREFGKRSHVVLERPGNPGERPNVAVGSLGYGDSYMNQARYALQDGAIGTSYTGSDNSRLTLGVSGTFYKNSSVADDGPALERSGGNVTWRSRFVAGVYTDTYREWGLHYIYDNGGDLITATSDTGTGSF